MDTETLERAENGRPMLNTQIRKYAKARFGGLWRMLFFLAACGVAGSGPKKFNVRG
jgi:hypothetical protein